MEETNMTGLIWDFYQSGKFTDLNIVFQKRIYKVHKLIVCARSNVFNIMCTNGFKESQMNVMNLDNDSDLDTAQLDSLIEWLYKSEYCGPRDSTSKTAGVSVIPKLGARSILSTAIPTDSIPRSEFLDADWSSGSCLTKFHAQMYALADKYEVSGLAAYAKEKYKAALMSDISIDGVLDSIVTVYTSTPESDRGLKSVAAAFVKRYISDFYDGKRLREVIKKAPDFGADIVELFRMDAWLSEGGWMAPQSANLA